MKRDAFFLCIVCSLIPLSLHAQLRISEIMYDLSEGSDSGREWIEIYNAGDGEVLLSTIRLLENGKKHDLQGVGASSLPAHTYAIIADTPEKFRADWPHYSGLLIDSAFSLNNSKETIALVTASEVLMDSVVYTNASANGTGDSLQREPVSGTLFKAGVPTPGQAIPQSGLTRTPVQVKAGTKKSSAQKSQLAATPIYDIVGEPSLTQGVVFNEGAVIAQQSRTFDRWWWLAPILIACSASGGIVVSQHYKKDEWEIEEIPETG